MKLCPTHKIIFKLLEPGGIVHSRVIGEHIGTTTRQAQPILWYFRRRIAREGYVLKAINGKGYWLEKSNEPLQVQGEHELRTAGSSGEHSGDVRMRQGKHGPGMDASLPADAS